MMTAYMSRLPIFCLSKNNWKRAKRRMVRFFAANEIEDPEIKRDLFLNSLDQAGYDLMNTLSSPIVPEEKSYDDLIKLYDAHFLMQLYESHFLPKESISSLRHRFHNAEREENETLHSWLARLRSLGSPCKFDKLDEMLLDRFVLGLPEGPVKDRLLEEDRMNLNIYDALEIAMAKEYELSSTTTAVMDAVEEEPVSSSQSEGLERTTTGISKGQKVRKVNRRKCKARNCQVNSVEFPNTRLFQFPANPERYTIWCEIAGTDPYSPVRNVFLCARHFDKSCFYSPERRTIIPDSNPKYATGPLNSITGDYKPEPR
uniref:THAP-type domain-containing protein n=1 Tax=Lygus hesperus TaxID=30085 RepID=A0A146LS88_LYGHE